MLLCVDSRPDTCGECLASGLPALKALLCPLLHAFSQEALNFFPDTLVFTHFRPRMWRICAVAG